MTDRGFRLAILRRSALAGLTAVAFALTFAAPASALERFDFLTPGASDDLRDTLSAASLLVQARRDRTEAPQDLFANAQADYGRLLGALYAEGHYSAVIRILIDGREAASILPLDAPDRIEAITVTVEPGPRFRFSRAAIAPLAPETALPDDYAAGRIARSGTIVDAAGAGVEGWRREGHAKAGVAGQKLTADHRDATLSADIALAPGPRVRFGTLTITGQQRMRTRAIQRIAGFPTGEVFDPDDLSRVATRLRRTGVFRSVALAEAETLGPGDTLDVALMVAEEKPRRLGFGAEIGSFEGLTLTGFWLHRNLFGGGERFRIDGEISGIGGESGGEDYRLGLRLDRPATFGPDTTGFATFTAEKLTEEDFSAENLSFGIGASRIFGEHLTAEVGVGLLWSRVEDTAGTTEYQALTLPMSATWEGRDSTLDPKRGLYLDAELTPFLGFSGTGTGARFWADARAYRGFGAEDRFVLAGRLQLATILGAQIEDTPRDYLFYSGGAGTVRGQPYQSLGVTVLGGGTVRSGGRSFLGLSGEVRAGVTKKIGVVAFYDAGFVGADELLGAGDWHAGAGLGLRYDTGIGPIRFDVATPVSGDTGQGVQLYVGIGQAF